MFVIREGICIAFAVACSTLFVIREGNLRLRLPLLVHSVVIREGNLRLPCRCLFTLFVIPEGLLLLHSVPGPSIPRNHHHRGETSIHHARICLHVGLCLLSPIASALPAEPRIPAVHATTFADNKVDLPEDLQGKVGILVVGFSQNSREAVTDWGKKLAADYYDSPSILYYEMPMLASVPKIMRGFVQGRIKSSVSDRGKPHFLPLVDNELSWRALAHYNKPDDPYILLVDGQGRVRWQSQGPPTDATYAALQQQLASIWPR